MGVLKKISIEAWFLLVLAMADSIFTYVLIYAYGGAEYGFLYFVCGKKLVLFFIIKAIITVGFVIFFEAARLYPHRMRIIFIPLFGKKTRNILLQPKGALCLLLIVYIGGFTFALLKVNWWLSFLKIFGFKP